MTETVKQRRRWGRRILVIAIATVLLFFLASAVLDFWAGSQVKGVEARLEQKYGSLDEGASSPTPVAEGENRARAIRAAMALIAYPPQIPRTKFYGDVSRFLSQRPPVPALADFRPFVASNSGLLVAFPRQKGWTGKQTLKQIADRRHVEGLAGVPAAAKAGRSCGLHEEN